jgi:hypothetical protein
MKCDSQVLFLAHTFVSPYFGHELKIRVMTEQVKMYPNKKNSKQSD